MKVAAVVILYHPPGNVVSNIMSYYEHVEKVYVFDNTETASSIEDELEKLPKVEFYHDGQNEGIGKRLNAATALALKDSFDWLLTMDQDSCFLKESINTYFKCFNEYVEKERVAMFGPVYSREVKSSCATCEPVGIDKMITSGMLLNLSLVATTGGFDERLFIDLVDYDYCVRAQQQGLSIVQFSNIHLLHHVGKEVYRSSIKTLFLVKKKKDLHSPLRCYYMYRNLLYLEEKYKGVEIPLVKELRGIVMGNLTACIYYGRNTLKIVRYLNKAYKDFKSMRMGRIDREVN